MTADPLGGMKSGYTDAGNGLFATTAFSNKSIITKYEGTELFDKLSAAALEDQTHVLHMSTDQWRLLGNPIYINGATDPVEGHGGASFCNHHCHSGNNAEFCIHLGWPHIRATKDINVTLTPTLTLTLTIESPLSPFAIPSPLASTWVEGGCSMHVCPRDSYRFVLMCVIPPTLIKDGEEIFVNCGTGTALDIMMGLKKRTVCQDKDGRRSVSTTLVPLDEVPPFPS